MGNTEEKREREKGERKGREKREREKGERKGREKRERERERRGVSGYAV